MPTRDSKGRFVREPKSPIAEALAHSILAELPPPYEQPTRLRLWLALIGVGASFGMGLGLILAPLFEMGRV